MIRISCFIFLVLSSFATDKIDNEFLEKKQKLRNEYRVKFSEVLLKADRVEISIVKFDEDIGESGSPFADVDDKEKIKVFNFGQTSVLKKRMLLKAEKDEVLKILSKGISNPDSSGGALCHYPIHGLKVYKKDKLIYEATFCWVCGNFGFHYPDGSKYLGTTKEMEKLFTKLMPIPQSEIERFNKKISNKDSQK